VSLSEAMYEGSACVEGITAVRGEGIPGNWSPGDPVILLEDPQCRVLESVTPFALVDAILAKRNLGTRMDLAPLVVALGPGFEAGREAHAVVETNRGHDLGRVLLEGCAEPNTGVPGLIAGAGRERVLHAPRAGRVEALCAIGDLVAPGDPILSVDGEVVRTVLAGVVRGLIRPGFEARAGLKVADVDPRCEPRHCLTVSDKARAIAGGVLEALLMLGEP
jgi:xanthine dehydrogenase accessory factor